MEMKFRKFWLFWMLISGILLCANCLPDFIKKLPTKKQEEYDALYEQRPSLTRTQFYDLRQNWAEKQGAKIKKEFRKFRRAEERYIIKRDEILKARLDEANGSNEAKNYLYELLDLQRDMNVTFKFCQQREEEMRHLISPSVLQEATKIWNQLDPAHID